MQQEHVKKTTHLALVYGWPEAWCVYGVFGRGITKYSHIQSYTVYTYGSGQPYTCPLLGAAAASDEAEAEEEAKKEMEFTKHGLISILEGVSSLGIMQQLSREWMLVGDVQCV